MDPAILTIVIAIIALIPTVLAVRSQDRATAKAAALEKERFEEDKRREKERLEQEKAKAVVDEKKADDDVIARDNVYLQGEVEKLRAKIALQDEALIAKTTLIGDMRLAEIDKDIELRTVKYQMEALKMKLANVNIEEAIPMSATIKKKEDTLPLNVKRELATVMSKKTIIERNTRREIEELRNGSITNGKGE